MNWSPEDTHLMSGSMEMTEAGTAFSYVNLEPDDYAWAAEIPDPAEHKLLKTFTISEQS